MLGIVIFFSLLLLIVLLIPRAKAPLHQGYAHTGEIHHMRNWDQDYSYLYYVNRQGILTYSYDFCRGCLEERANELHRKGFKVTEVVLGTKDSGDV